MSKYLCQTCHCEFNEPAYFEERVPYGDTHIGWNGTFVCPYCQSEYFDEIDDTVAEELMYWII